MITDSDTEKQGKLTGKIILQVRGFDVRCLDGRNDAGPRHHRLISTTISTNA